MAELKIENFDQASKIIERLIRKTPQHVVGAFSPTIIHASLDKVGEDGVVGSMIFPCEGAITKVAIFLSGASKREPATVSIEVNFKGQITNKSLILTQEVTIFKYQVTISEGEILKIYAPAGASITLSVMFMPKVGDYKIENYLIDNLESAADERVRNATDENISSGSQGQLTES